MKVLLLEDVDKLGLAGKVVTVSDGYARNYLLPRGLAKVAGPGALQQAEQVAKAGERKRARLMSDAQALAQRIEAVTLTFQARAGEKGKLYGSITTAELAETSPIKWTRMLCSPTWRSGSLSILRRSTSWPNSRPRASASSAVVMEPYSFPFSPARA